MYWLLDDLRRNILLVCLYYIVQSIESLNFLLIAGWSNKEIVIFLKEPHMDEESRAICDHLYKIGVLHFTDKRWVGPERIVVDDDENILDYAYEKGGVIISLDQFRDAYKKWPQYRDVIKNRLLQFSFVQGDEFYVAPHPLGPKGPHREEIWKF